VKLESVAGGSETSREVNTSVALDRIGTPQQKTNPIHPLQEKAASAASSSQIQEQGAATS
jgi:hypothetical protein